MSYSIATGALQVLVVDDNPTDTYLILEALRLACASCEVEVLRDGASAWRYLRREGPYQAVPLPSLVVLDLNLPGRDGGELLDMMRGTPELHDIPVAVLSSFPTDVIRRRAARANCYMTKPSDLDSFLALGKEILACL